MSREGVLRAVATVAVIAVVVAGFLLLRGRSGDDDPYADYCKSVAAHRGLISAAVGQGATTGLLAALPSFEELRAKSPSDIANDWDMVIGAITNLRDTLNAAGVDPASYDRDHPPKGLTRQQKAHIDAAATRLDSTETRDALSSVDQEARDVCHSPLMM